MITAERSLQKIAREIQRCRICKQGKRGKAVPGEGSARSRVMFVGEAPGKEEAELGRPFVGRSGKFLRGQIAAIGLGPRDAFITSPVKYLPKRGTPTVRDIRHGATHLRDQIDIIKPKIVLLLGRVACYASLQKPLSASKHHGKVIKRDGVRYFITPHPAAALRFPHFRRLFINDFKKLKRIISEWI